MTKLLNHCAIRTLITAASCALVLQGCNKRDDVQGYKDSDPMMNRAYTDARSSVQTFIQQLAAPKAGYRYLVKIRIEAKGEVEHVWIEPVRYEDDVFRGPMANSPAKIQSMKLGDVIQAKPDVISDWVVLDGSGNVVYGGFTQKVMEKHLGVKP